MNDPNLERRGLFSSLLFSKKKEKTLKFIRPPYFKDENFFYERCTECNSECKNACEEKIIFINDDKTPYLNFENSGCTYCNLCALACPSDVLSVEYIDNIFATFEIDMIKCISWNNTMCFLCRDKCNSNAIEFLGLFRPTINMNLCVSCGFCFAPCPTNAISYEKIEKDNKDEGSI